MRVERGVNRSVCRFDPGDAKARQICAAVRRKAAEAAAEDNLAVRLHRHCQDSAVHVWIERSVNGSADRSEPGHVVAGDGCTTVRRKGGKSAADENLAIRLHRDDKDTNATNTVRVRIKAGINRSVCRLEPGDAVA